ncbi:MAG TPA: hypothetical protein VKB46_20610 [Pyrinomonadaceae bacterium]|nr:hypothetical protein [Pyrinomonadaceae bacterium]
MKPEPLYSENLSDAQPRKVKLEPLYSENLSDTQPRLVKPPTPVPVVRTLKPPPEIWELVPVNEFKPVDSANRSSSNLIHPIILSIVIGLVGAGVLYFWKLGSPQPVTKAPPATQNATASQPAPQPPPATQPATTNAEAGATTSQAPAPNPAPTNPAVTSSAPANAVASGADKSTAIQPADSKRGAGLTPPTASLSGLGLSKKDAKKPETSAAGVDVSEKQPASSTANGADAPSEPRPKAQVSTADPPVKTPSVAPEKSANASESEKKGATDPAATKPKSTGAVSPPPNAPAKAEETPKPKVIKWP